ncbi:MAG: GH25 family lysozyme, partial [Oscillospiraceae bacterium]
LPVFNDFEWDKILHNTSYAQRTSMLRHGMVLLDQNGYTPGFYSNWNWATHHYDASALQAEGYDFWYANYFDNSPSRSAKANHGWPGKTPALWQYSSRAHIAGIAGNVDVNHCFKDYSFKAIRR